MEHISGNIFIRPILLGKAGDSIIGHAHNFDHTTYIVRGAVRVEQLLKTGDTAEGEPVFDTVRSIDKKASQGHNWVLIRAGVIHRITALEDDSLGHCIYAHRTPQGDIVQEWDGWEKAYV